MPMSLPEVQVVDPVLSKVAFGFTLPEAVGYHLFPKVSIQNYQMTLMKYDKSAFVTHNFKRAPGSNVQEVMYSYGNEKISLIQESVFTKVPKEWLKAGQALPGVSQEIRAVNMTMAKLSLALEKEHAEIAQNPAGYGVNHQVTLTSGSSFADSATNTYDIIAPLKQSVRKSIARKPNVIVIPSEVLDALDGNNLIRDKFKYTSSASVTAEMLAQYWQVEKVVVAESLSAVNEDDTEMTDVWNDIVMAYVPPESMRDFAPAYGYTYEWEGHPIVHEKDFNKDNQSWRNLLEWERRAYQHGAGAGALIRNPLA